MKREELAKALFEGDLQRLWNEAYWGLAKQGFRQSMTAIRTTIDGDKVQGCAYRGAHGRKCAVGHLIDDADYQLAFETRTVTTVLRDMKINNPYGYNYNKGLDLLTELQSAHDRVSTNDLRRIRIIEIGEKLGLKVPANRYGWVAERKAK